MHLGRRDVSADDSLLKEITEAEEHLLRDMASISGINPLFSLTPEQFNRLAEVCSTIIIKVQNNCLTKVGLRCGEGKEGFREYIEENY